MGFTFYEFINIDPKKDPYLTGREAEKIDTYIDEFNVTIWECQPKIDHL